MPEGAAGRGNDLDPSLSSCACPPPFLAPHPPLKTVWSQLHWSPTDPMPQEAGLPQSWGMQVPSWPHLVHTLHGHSELCRVSHRGDKAQAAWDHGG